MTQMEIGMLIIVSVWSIVAIILAIVMNGCLKPQNRGLFPHPVVGLIRDNRTDHNVGPAAKVWVPIVFILLLLPITLEWFIIWCIWVTSKKFAKWVNSDDASHTSAEVENETNVEEEKDATEIELWEEPPANILPLASTLDLPGDPVNIDLTTEVEFSVTPTTTSEVPADNLDACEEPIVSEEQTSTCEEVSEVTEDVKPVPKKRGRPPKAKTVTESQTEQSDEILA